MPTSNTNAAALSTIRYMASTRANFSPTTRELLSKRAGFRCSFPRCGAPTTGPSAESDSAVSNSGMACHIWAASAGGSARRVSTTMTTQELEDASNGIWMCYTHGKLIDTDEDTYSVDVLLTWKKIAELRARLSQELGRDIDLTPRDLSAVPLPSDSLRLNSLGAENNIIGDALSRSCVEQIWGVHVARAARDVLIELTRNAFDYGSAKIVRLEIRANHIEIVDDGRAFDSSKLCATDGGGSLSVLALSEDHAAAIVFRSSFEDGLNHNKLTLVRKPADVLAATPCSLTIGYTDLSTLREQIIALTTCDTVYVLLPKYAALSDAFRLPKAIADAAPSDKKLVFVGQGLSERVVHALRGASANIEVLNFES